MKRMMTVLTCSAATAFALAATAPAQAQTVEYTLSISPEVSGESREATLECDPAGGSHPRAEEACDLIAEHGDIAGVRGAEGPCPMIYAPVTVRVTGAEEYEQTFGNECVLNHSKGAVFGF